MVSQPDGVGYHLTASVYDFRRAIETAGLDPLTFQNIARRNEGRLFECIEAYNENPNVGFGCLKVSDLSETEFKYLQLLYDVVINYASTHHLGGNALPIQELLKDDRSCSLSGSAGLKKRALTGSQLCRRKAYLFLLLGIVELLIGGVNLTKGQNKVVEYRRGYNLLCKSWEIVCEPTFDKTSKFPEVQLVSYKGYHTVTAKLPIVYVGNEGQIMDSRLKEAVEQKQCYVTNGQMSDAQAIEFSAAGLPYQPCNLERPGVNIRKIERDFWIGMVTQSIFLIVLAAWGVLAA